MRSSRVPRYGQREAGGTTAPHVLFDSGSTREDGYGRIKDIERNMYE